MEKILCKLTNKKDQTYNNTQWGENVKHESSGKKELCTNGWIHYYDSPLLAVLLNPIHGKFDNPHLWEIAINGKIKEDCGLKFGTTSLTTIKRIKLPVITSEQTIIFGILCSMEVYKDSAYTKWGNNWIDKTDRTAEAAEAAEAAAWTAEAAAWTAEATAKAAAWTAWTAEATAKAAAWAAWAAEATAEAAEGVIDLHLLAVKAISYK